MEYTVITRKIQIVVNEPDSIVRKEHYKRLRDIQSLSFRYANDVVNNLLFLDKTKLELGRGKDKITPEELDSRLKMVFGGEEGKKFGQQNFGYKYGSEKYDELPSYIRASVSNKVYQHYVKNKKEVFFGDKVVSTYRKDNPVFFPKKCVLNFNEESDGIFTFTFFKIPIKTFLGRDKSNNKIMLQRIITGEYQMCDSSFRFEENKLFLYLCIKVPNRTNILDENKVLGIDLGINVPITFSVNNTEDRGYFGSREEFTNKRLALQKSRRNLSKALVNTNGGKGRNKKLKKLEDFREKELNFALTYNHKGSKWVIDKALMNGCGQINVEDLSSISKSDKNQFVLRNWSYYQLQSLIEYKAKREGIKVVKVNPEYTSQCCSRCNHIESDNRQSQSEFKCMACGYELNADINASKNISRAHTDEWKKLVAKHKKTKKPVEELVEND